MCGEPTVLTPGLGRSPARGLPVNHTQARPGGSADELSRSPRHHSKPHYRAVQQRTAWDGSTLLEETAAHNQTLEASDGVRRHFAYDWTAGAAEVAAYGAYVVAERDRLGEAHPLFQTQYALRPVAGSGRLLGPAHLAQL